MGKPFKLSLVSDVRDFLKGAKSVEDSLEKVAASLDDVSTVGDNVESAIVNSAKESSKSLDKLSATSTKAAKTIDKGFEKVEDSTKDFSKAVEKTERKFSDAARKMKEDAEAAGKGIKKGLGDGAEEASEGMTELREEAVDSAREMAASFSGSFDDIGDLAQEVAANAFKGFGPAGLAAGIAAASGIGYLISSLQESAEEANKAKEGIVDLANEINDVGGDARALDWASKLREKLTEITDDVRWFEFWQDDPKTRLEEWSDAAKKWGFTVEDATKAVSGNQESLARVMSVLNKKYDEQSQKAKEARQEAGRAADGAGESAAKYEAAAAEIDAFRNSIQEQIDATKQATELNDQLNQSLAGIADAVAESQAATELYEQAVVASLTNAGENWEAYVQNGVVNLDRYNDAIEEQAKAVADFENNLIAASGHLSDEALNYIRSLGPEAAPLLKAFINSPLDERERTARNWDTIGRAATDGYKQSLRLEEKTRAAADAAQKAAAGKPITFTTALKSSDLQAQVNRAAANIDPPVIEVRVKARKVID